jgi:hypothetical protein
MLRRAGLPLFAALATASILAPAADAHRTSFAAGTYTASTAQSTTFRFRIIAHTSTNNCGSKAGAHCFVALSDPSIDETCSDGTSYDAGLFAVPNGFVSPTGHFAYHQSVEDSNPLVDFRIHVVGTRATGSLREEGPIGTTTCDSGTVTFRAKRS